MIKCEAIIDFTLEKFDELKNIQRKSIEQKGKLFEGDIFECDENMVKYLTGKNEKGATVVKVIEVIPEVVIDEKEVKKEIVKSKKKKISKK